MYQKFRFFRSPGFACENLGGNVLDEIRIKDSSGKHFGYSYTESSIDNQKNPR